jgi:hypothetical protein
MCRLNNFRLIIFCLASIIAIPTASSSSKVNQEVDVVELKKRFIETIGPHFTIVKDQVFRQSNWHGGNLYWLVNVKPTHSGHFALKYRYKYNDPLYSHVERVLRMRVGKQGCRRGPLGHGRYSKICLGDTMILPIVLNKFTEFEFSLVATDEVITDEAYPDMLKPIPGNTVNPAAEHLALVGTNSLRMLHRSLGYTTKLVATFEARKPGRFNLSLSSSDVALPAEKLLPGSFPIIVIDRNTPITALISNDNVTGFSIGPNGQEYSSSSGGNDSYVTNVVILQIGDRYTFEYASIRSDGETERAERASGGQLPDKAAPLTIRRLPFTFDKDWSHNEWIQEYLPGT